MASDSEMFDLDDDEIKPRVDDDDDISITSTVESEEKSEYEVETILAEATLDGDLRYLVKWTGYSYERATWEPKESFTSEKTFKEWRRKKKAIREGKMDPFDVVAWQNKIDAILEAKEERKKRREAKRLRLRRLNIGLRSTAAAASRLADEQAARLSTKKKPPVRSSATKKTEAQARKASQPTQPAVVQARKPTEPPQPGRLSKTTKSQVRPTDVPMRDPSPQPSKLQLLQSRVTSPPIESHAPTDFPVQQLPSNRPKPRLLLRDRTSSSTAVTGNEITNTTTEGPSLGGNNVAPVKMTLGPMSPPERKKSLKTDNKRSDNKRFKFLSTMRRYEKMKQREPAPDMSKLELMRPSEWRPANTTTIASARRLTTTLEAPASTETDLFVPVNARDINSDLAISLKQQSPEDFWFAPGSPAEGLSAVVEPAETKETDDNTVLLDDSTPEYEGPPSGDSPRPSESKLLAADGAKREEGKERESTAPRNESRKMFFGERSLSPGEVLVSVTYGPDRKVVGAVKLCGVTPQTRHKLVNARTSGSKKNYVVELWFRYILSFDQYDRLCAGSRKPKFCNGWLEAYEDTEESLHMMSMELRTRKVVAVCQPTDPKQNVFVAYWPETPEFQFFNEGFSNPPKSICLLVLRESLAPITLLRDVSNGKIIPPPTNNDNNAPLPSPSASNQPIQESTIERRMIPFKFVPVPSAPKHTEPANKLTDLAKRSVDKTSLGQQNGVFAASEEEHISSDIDGLSMCDSSDESDPESQTSLPVAPNLSEPASVTGPSSQPPEFNLPAIFEKDYSMNYQTLATASDGELANAFYLVFPSEKDEVATAEFKLIQLWVECHRGTIFSNMRSGDWDHFVENFERGTILFHCSFMNYYEMPFLATALRKQFNFWRVSLSNPLPFTNPPEHFERLFPDGGAILLTEEFMVSRTDATNIILYWFIHVWLKAKSPERWKIMVRPDILEWLLAKHDSLEDGSEQEKSRWLWMYHLIKKLIPKSESDVDDEIDMEGFHNPRAPNNVIIPTLPHYAVRDGTGRPIIAKTTAELQRDTELLVEYFAGWSIVCCTHFRKFVVVCDYRDILKRWTDWHHIEFVQGSKEFLNTYKVDYKKISKKLGSHMPPERPPLSASRDAPRDTPPPPPPPAQQP